MEPIIIPVVVTGDDAKLMGKRFRTLKQDSEEDEEFGVVIHPVGSEFIVTGKPATDCDEFFVHWQGESINSAGASVPSRGMWTIWTREEIQKEAEPVESAQ